MRDISGRCGVGVVALMFVGFGLLEYPVSTEQTSAPPLVSQALYDHWIEELSNWGRWGPDDELGAFNLVTPEKRAAAAALVTEGVTVSLASDAQDYESVDVPCPVQWSMTRATRTGASDEISYPCIHGPGTTHLDAFAHVFFLSLIHI